MLDSHPVPRNDKAEDNQEKKCLALFGRVIAEFMAAIRKESKQSLENLMLERLFWHMKIRSGAVCSFLSLLEGEKCKDKDREWKGAEMIHGFS